MEKYLNSLIVRNATEIVEQPIRLAPLAQRLANASMVNIKKDRQMNKQTEGQMDN